MRKCIHEHGQPLTIRRESRDGLQQLGSQSTALINAHLECAGYGAVLIVKKKVITTIVVFLFCARDDEDTENQDCQLAFSA